MDGRNFNNQKPWSLLAECWQHILSVGLRVLNSTSTRELGRTDVFVLAHDCVLLWYIPKKMSRSAMINVNERRAYDLRIMFIRVPSTCWYKGWVITWILYVCTRLYCVIVATLWQLATRGKFMPSSSEQVEYVRSSFYSCTKNERPTAVLQPPNTHKPADQGHGHRLKTLEKLQWYIN